MLTPVLLILAAAAVGLFMSYRRAVVVRAGELISWEDDKRVVKAGAPGTVAIVCAFGALAAWGFGGGFGGGIPSPGDRGGKGPPVEASYAAPDTPTVDVVVFAATGDSARVLGSVFSGDQDDTHDSTRIQVDTAGGDFTSPQYHNVTLGAVTTDTVAALDSGAVAKVRMAYKGLSGGWSAWSDTLQFEAVSVPTPNLVNWDPSTYTDSADYVDDHTGNGGLFEQGDDRWIGTYPGALLDPDTAAPGYSKTVRYTYNHSQGGNGTPTGCGSTYEIRRDINYTQQDTIAVEVYLKFSPNFTTVWEEGNTNPPAGCEQMDFKTFHFGTSGLGRWGFKIGNGGQFFLADRPIYTEFPNSTSGLPGGDLEQVLQNGDVSVDPTDFFDGVWHTIRLYVVAGTSSDGIYKVWLDGNLITSVTGFSVASSNAGPLDIQVFSNKDDGPQDLDMFAWIQYVKVWGEGNLPSWAN